MSHADRMRKDARGQAIVAIGLVVATAVALIAVYFVMGAVPR